MEEGPPRIDGWQYLARVWHAAFPRPSLRPEFWPRALLVIALFMLAPLVAGVVVAPQDSRIAGAVIGIIISAAALFGLRLAYASISAVPDQLLQAGWLAGRYSADPDWIEVSDETRDLRTRTSLRVWLAALAAVWVGSIAVTLVAA